MRLVRRSRILLGAGLLGVLVTGCAKAGVTDQAQEVHSLYVTIAAIAAPVFIIVEVLLLFMVIRYRKRDDEAPPQQMGSTRAFSIFFLIPLVIVTLLYAFGETTLASIQKEDPHPRS